MKVSFLLILFSITSFSQLFAQGFNENATKEVRSLAKISDSSAVVRSHEHKKPNRSIAISSSTVGQSYSKTIIKLEEKIANQQIIIQSQEMMIEQIMKRLEILEKGHQEKPLGIVLNSTMHHRD